MPNRIDPHLLAAIEAAQEALRNEDRHRATRDALDSLRRYTASYQNSFFDNITFDHPLTPPNPLPPYSPPPTDEAQIDRWWPLIEDQPNPPEHAWSTIIPKLSRQGQSLLEARLQERYGFARPTDTMVDSLANLSSSYLLYKSPLSTLWAKLLALRGIDVACDATGEFMEGDPKNRDLKIPFLHIQKHPIQDIPERPEVIYTLGEQPGSLRGYAMELLRSTLNYTSNMKLVRWTRTE